jgi:hypothetical protein
MPLYRVEVTGPAGVAGEAAVDADTAEAAAAAFVADGTDVRVWSASRNRDSRPEYEARRLHQAVPQRAG